MIHVAFEAGTLRLDGPVADHPDVAGLAIFDERIDAWRTEAVHYAEIVLYLHENGIPYNDTARDYGDPQFKWRSPHRLRPYQEAAVKAWIEARGRGVIVLPTGSGKSLTALAAVYRVNRPALIVVPTLDLMEQWAHQVEAVFGMPAGLYGGGCKDIREITVSTYDSAVLTMEFHGNRYGTIVFDECHHLPGPVNRTAASMAIAPYRLGLTATPERTDGGDEVLDDLVGPICYRRDIDEFEGDVLSEYRTQRIAVPLEPAEATRYQEARARYVAFVRAHRIDFSRPDGWQQFVGLAARLPGGREAFDAYLEQKRISRASRGKFRAIWSLLRRHAGERTLIFTADNDTAYAIGRQLLLPVITHRTKLTERKAFLDAFRAGDYPVLVTSRVLNEGVDVPEARVGIVVSGSGSVREHVQRLGRLLRPAEGKQAMLYELISEGTGEQFTSERRRQHRAYQRPHQSH